jgi:hypothetical protein
VVALDPVYHRGSFAGEGEMVWDPAVDGPKILVPAGILGAPPSACNAAADYADIFPLLGTAHKASFHVVDASHCVFSDPGSTFCGFICEGATGQELTTVSKKYMVAWFNYYLQDKVAYYDYLFGSYADADVAANRVVISAKTFPKGFTAVSGETAVKLAWDRYEHPVVAGYDIYRRLPTEPAFGSPIAATGLTTSYLDTQVVAGQEYIYAVGSFDAAGNRHQRSDERRVVFNPAAGGSEKLFLPMITAP